MATPVSRRSFLKAGLIGTLALAAAGTVYRVTRRPELPGKFVMDDAAQSVLSGIVPVMLKGAIGPSPQDIMRVIAGIQSTIANLPLSAQKEIQELFALLALGPSRRFLAGIPDDWPQARQEDIATFLQNWRTSRFGLLQSAYLGLHDLIIGTWYADESSWASIGYPGPLKELS